MNSTLSIERLRHVLAYDKNTGLFTRRLQRERGRKHEAGTIAGTLCKGYVQISIDGRFYLGHRLAWMHAYGELPTGHIDHINGIKNDNRLANLRDVSRTTNAQNQRSAMRSNKTSGLLGVSSAHGGKWRATIQYCGKQKRLGVFDSPSEAHSVYLAAKRDLHKGCTI